MELVDRFGIDYRLLAAQIVNFLIVLYLLKRFLYKPILKVLKDRQNSIQVGLEKAEEARKLLEKAKDEERAILKVANTQAGKLLENARNQASQLLLKNEEKMKAQTEKMIEEARSQIIRDVKTAEVKLTRSISQIAAMLLEKALTGMVSKETQEEVLEKTIRNLKKQSN